MRGWIHDSKVLTCWLIPVVLAAPVAAAETDVADDSAGWFGSIMGLYVSPDSERFDIDYGAGARVALGRPISERLDIEFAAFGNVLERDARSGSDWQYGLGADLLAHLRREGTSPYLIAGGGGLYNDYSSGSSTRPYANLGAGLKFRELWNRLSLRIEARYHVDGADDAARRGHYGEPRFLIGLQFPLSPAPQNQTRVTEITQSPTVVEREHVVEKIPELQVLEGVTFAFNSADLEHNARAALRQNARLLALHPEVRLEIAGHTCNQGDPDYNQRLSLARAEAVRNFLIDEGIAPQRLDATGYGEQEPIADNRTEQGRQENRRIEIRRLD